MLIYETNAINTPNNRNLLHMFILVWIYVSYFSLGKSDEDDNLPSMETLDINKSETVKSISNHFGVEEEEDIPDMAEFENSDSLVEDPVSCYNILCCCSFSKILILFQFLALLIMQWLGAWLSLEFVCCFAAINLYVVLDVIIPMNGLQMFWNLV